MIRERDVKILFHRAQLKMSRNNDQERGNQYPNSYVIKLTTDCNLRCQYCYMGDDYGDKKYMDKGLFIYLLNEIKKLSDRFTIYLHGGEPCLNIDLIYELEKWLKKNQLQQSVSVMLQTNGTIINEDIIELIKRMHINLGVSLDGVLDEANGARISNCGTSSTEIVLKNIKKLMKHNISMGIFSVLTNYNARYMLEMIQKLSGMGIRNFVINPLVLWGNAENKRSLMATQEQVYEIYASIIDWIGTSNKLKNKDEQVTERNIHWWAKGMLEGIKGYMCNCSPCGAGLQTVAISPSGKVYICDQYYGDERFQLGDISKAPLGEILQKGITMSQMLRNVNEIDACRRCEWRFVCCGGCTASAFYYHGNMDGVAPYCEAYKKIFSYMELKLENNQIIL